MRECQPCGSVRLGQEHALWGTRKALCWVSGEYYTGFCRYPPRFLLTAAHHVNNVLTYEWHEANRPVFKPEGSNDTVSMDMFSSVDGV